MKKIILFLTMLLAAVGASADNYKSLVFQTSSGTTAVDLTSLVMTVSDGKLVAKNSNGTQSFTLTDLTKMYFSTETATGISNITSNSDNTPVTIYDINGRTLGTYSNLSSATASLRKGVYVLKQNGKTFKIAVK